MKSKAVVYIHGKGGSAVESVHYEPLFPNCEVIGFDYKAATPWAAEEEFPAFFNEVFGKYREVILIANSIGAYFAMTSLSDFPIRKAYFISPIADMEDLIRNMMRWANVSDEELRNKGEISTDFGETLSWKYLTYAKEHRPEWKVATAVLYGAKDTLTSVEVISAFAERIGAELTVMKEGEHWFHTEEQMAFLDEWIKGDFPRPCERIVQGKRIFCCADRGEWRDWLAEHFEKEKEIWFVFPNVDSGEIGVSYNDAVEEALCFGWIDGRAGTLDDKHQLRRFTPRRKGSPYSQPNIERLISLESQGLIHPKIAESVRDIIRVPFVFPQDILDAIKNDRKAWKNFQAFTEPYKRIRIAYIDAARKRPAEFEKRLENFIRKTRENKLIVGYGGVDKYYQ